MIYKLQVLKISARLIGLHDLLLKTYPRAKKKKLRVSLLLYNSKKKKKDMRS
jgi:hypothetical protein